MVAGAMARPTPQGPQLLNLLQSLPHVVRSLLRVLLFAEPRALLPIPAVPDRVVP